MQALIELQQRCADLGWKTIARRLDALLEEASANRITYAEFVSSLVNNLLFLGPPGVGKSHLSVAIALEAIHQGQTALFVRADEFMEAAREVVENRQVPKFLRRYARPSILILDEMGYAPLMR